MQCAARKDHPIFRPMHQFEPLGRAGEDDMVLADDGTAAQGAIKAALWARGKKPGFYTMTDVLGLADF